MRKKGGPDFKCLWYLPVSVPVLQILEDTGKILVLPELCTSIVVPVSRPAASYYPNWNIVESSVKHHKPTIVEIVLDNILRKKKLV